MKIVVVTNIPSPYRITFFDEISRQWSGEFIVLYCAKNEGNRGWDPQKLNHIHHFLKERKLIYKGRAIYFNPDIWTKLKKIKPDIIVTGGFTPTMLHAILYSKFYTLKHFITTDAWEKTEHKLSFIHKIARKFIYKGAHVFLPVSIKGANQIRTYHVDPKKIFICPYTVNNEKFLLSGVEKKYDLMFSGQFIPRKMPSFFLEIVEKLSHKNPNLSILLLGDGPLKEFIINKLTQLNVKFYYPGFVQPEDLPVFYSQTRIFLFPTEEDAWGVVANEACAAGVPVMTCENAGAANELIIDNYNGYVLPLNSDIWVDKILKVLGDIELQKILSTNCLLQIKKYTKEFSAQSFIKACNSI